MILPNWNAPKNVKAISSTRIGGYSTAPYKGLNLGMHVGDEPMLVEKNRQALIQRACMPNTPVWLNQTHSTQVIALDSSINQTIDADGSFTEQSCVVCAVMTADCLPVLLCDSRGRQVAAVHAGWRGLAGGIVENALELFDGEVMAWLGPAIGPLAFEVGDDVVDAFCSHDRQAERAFKALPQAGKWLADMSLLAIQRLSQCGITQVSSCNQCTYSDTEHFYSYRHEGVTGRQASFIWLE